VSKRSSDYPPLMDPPKPRGMRVLSSSQATVILVLSLATSRLSGFIREILIAPTFGYGINTDAYYIGFQIPDLAIIVINLKMSNFIK
jgi:peptidoglycan biosynthesis protein MviN/MurJ (putative lipid II flippase)